MSTRRMPAEDGDTGRETSVVLAITALLMFMLAIPSAWNDLMGLGAGRQRRDEGCGTWPDAPPAPLAKRVTQ
jgi:hypothetical protein